MPFELKEPTQAKINSVTPRIEKHGDDNVPAVSLGIKITGPNTLLDLLVPGLREVLYKPVEGQEALEGMEHMPLLRTRACERIKLKMPAMEGWRLCIEHGIEEDSAIDLHSCKVDKVHVEPFEGGSCEVSFRVGTSDVDERYMGELAMKLGSEVPITLLAPDKQPDQPAIDGTGEEFAADHPDAGDLFAEAHGDDDPSISTGDGGAADELDDVSDAEGLDMHADRDGPATSDDVAAFEAGARAAIGSRAPVSPGVEASRRRMRSGAAVR